MRLPEVDIALIDRAARRQGRSRTDFVRAAAVRAAEEELMDARMVRLSEAGFDDFVHAISKPGTAVPELVDIFRRPEPWSSSESVD